MPDKEDTVVNFPLPDQNLIQNFVLESSAIRGRVIRLGSVLDKIVSAHDAPEAIAHLMAETVALSAVLSSMLKYEGIFILQVQGDGPVSMVVCDVNSEGHVRGCVTYNEEKYKSKLKEKKGGSLNLEDMFGTGYLAFTVDQGAHTERYQGIVALDGENLEECVQHYFEQSEQVETVIRLSVGRVDDAWRAGGIMIQRMPLDEKDVQSEVIEQEEENWARSSILLKTCKDVELLDEKLHENTILLRLFHEEGVRVLDSKDLIAKCRCSEERLLGILSTMPKDDIEHIIEDGKIMMTCEFCKTTYAIIPPDELL